MNSTGTDGYAPEEYYFERRVTIRNMVIFRVWLRFEGILGVH